MSTDPLKLTRDDLTLIIKEMREKRAQFNLGNLKAGSMKPKTGKAALVDKLDLGGINL